MYKGDAMRQPFIIGQPDLRAAFALLTTRSYGIGVVIRALRAFFLTQAPHLMRCPCIRRGHDPSGIRQFCRAASPVSGFTFRMSTRAAVTRLPRAAGTRRRLPIHPGHPRALSAEPQSASSTSGPAASVFEKECSPTAAPAGRLLSVKMKQSLIDRSRARRLPFPGI